MVLRIQVCELFKKLIHVTGYKFSKKFKHELRKNSEIIFFNTRVNNCLTSKFKASHVIHLFPDPLAKILLMDEISIGLANLFSFFHN